tara:strand:- start:500 stop:1123 length:624 start_codon:yes stop_codon:yes gene_type:complete
MNNKEKVLLINELIELQQVEEFTQQLEETPLTEDIVAMLPSSVRNKNHHFLMELRQTGKLVRPMPVPLSEFVSAATGFVVKQSTIDQMEREEYRLLIRNKLIPSTKLEIYPDIDRATETIEHYNFQLKTPNGYVDRNTGGVDMVRVAFKTFDEEQSDNNVGRIIDAQQGHKTARNEIDWLLQNLESIKEGNYNTQYHDETRVGYLEV